MSLISINVISITDFNMTEGFDPRKSKIGEKSLVNFIEADTIASLDSVCTAGSL